VKLGAVGRMDHSGLGVQTRNLTYMLRPDSVMLIDSTSFNGRDQHPDWYDSFQTTVINGFPTNLQCNQFLNGLTHLIICEAPMNYHLIGAANYRGVKVIFQPNWEFLDHAKNGELPHPYRVVAPSPWHLADIERVFGAGIVRYIPPPTMAGDFAAAWEANRTRTGRRRFLHLVGQPAARDRNGTEVLLAALSHSQADFEMMIRSQKPLGYESHDHRVKFDFSDASDQAELYTGSDALILPRRYGGLCLPMNEALLSGLPVIMPDCSPNNDVLPERWLVPGAVTGSFMTRAVTDLFEADARALGVKLDWLAGLTDAEMLNEKTQAYALGYKNYSMQAVKPAWEEVLND
jgi:glycosyltransferase involved in cell wall biosynthesis